MSVTRSVIGGHVSSKLILNTNTIITQIENSEINCAAIGKTFLMSISIIYGKIKVMILLVS